MLPLLLWPRGEVEDDIGYKATEAEIHGMMSPWKRAIEALLPVGKDEVLGMVDTPSDSVQEK